MYTQIGAKAEEFDLLLNQIKEIREEYTTLAALPFFSEYLNVCKYEWHIYNTDTTTTQYIDIESKRSLINDASSIQEMSTYIENLKSDVENANEIIQSLLPLRVSLEQSTLRSLWNSIVNRRSWDSKSLRTVGVSDESHRIKGNAISWRNVRFSVKLCGLGKCSKKCALSLDNSNQWINIKFQNIFECLYPISSLLILNLFFHIPNLFTHICVFSTFRTYSHIFVYFPHSSQLSATRGNFIKRAKRIRKKKNIGCEVRTRDLSRVKRAW